MLRKWAIIVVRLRVVIGNKLLPAHRASIPNTSFSVSGVVFNQAESSKLQLRGFSVYLCLGLLAMLASTAASL